MLTLAWSLVLCSAGVQEPEIELSSSLLPAKGSVRYETSFAVRFTGGKGVEVRSDWVDQGAWGVRDGAGTVHRLGERESTGVVFELPEGALFERRFSLDAVLPQCVSGEGSLLFFGHDDREPKAVADFRLAREIDASKVDFGDPSLVPDERLGHYRVQVETSIAGKPQSVMTFELWPDIAPLTVRNFLRYASEGYYEELKFHRIVRGFMVQGGLARPADGQRRSYAPIPGEFTKDRRFRHQRGVISMAQTPGDPNSAVAQFFICHGNAPWLDGKFAAFGRLLEGDSALEALASVEVKAGPSGHEEVPVPLCLIRRVRVFLLK